MTLFLFYNSFKEKINDLLLKNNIREVDQAFNLIKKLINETDTSYPMLDTIDDIARFDPNPDQLMVKLLYVLSYMYKKNDFWVKIFTLVYEFTSILLSYQDDKCLRKERKDDTLFDHICNFSYKRSYITTSYRMGIDKSFKLDKGGNAIIFLEKFLSDRHEIDVVTKVPNKFSKFMFFEAFVNIVIINKILQNKPSASLVPTYGITIESDMIESYIIALTQKSIPSITLTDFIYSDKFTLQKVKKILLSVFTTLQLVYDYESYKVIHNDLSTNNILVNEDGENCWIIDWGYASFTSNGERYNRTIETYYDKVVFISGLYDLCFLLDNIYYFCNRISKKLKELKVESVEVESVEVKKYESDIKKYESIMFWIHDIINKLVDENINIFSTFKDRDHFDRNLTFYDILKRHENDLTHKENIKLLEKFTYKFIISRLNEIYKEEEVKSRNNIGKRKNSEALVDEVNAKSRRYMSMFRVKSNKVQVKKSKVKKSNVKKSNVKKTDVKKSNVKKTDVKKSNVKKTDVKKSNIKKTDVKKTK